MAATLTSTGITFSDGTSLSSAAPAIGAVGSYVWAYDKINIPSAPGNTTWYTNVLATGTTIAGSNLAADVKSNSVISSGYSTGYIYYSSISYSPSGRQTGTFFSSGANTTSWNQSVPMFGGAASSRTTMSSSTNTSYTTPSGSWRSVTGHTQANYYENGYNYSIPTYAVAMWQRYA